MKVEVTTPEDFLGRRDRRPESRRGQIQGMEPRANAQVVRAHVPLAEMFGYATDLRSATQGRATYSMEFDSLRSRCRRRWRRAFWPRLGRRPVRDGPPEWVAIVERRRED